jgi:hypothetical protein
MMARRRRQAARALAGALLTVGCFSTALLVNTAAIASCDPAVDPAAHTTPVGDAVCGSASPSPSPRPTTSHTPSPSPTATATQNVPPPTFGGPPPVLPPGYGGYPIPTAFPSYVPQPTGQPFVQPTTPGQTDPYPIPGYFSGTQAGLRVKPGGGGFFALRAILFLLGAAAGAFTLYEARVRRWMVGI